MSSSFRSACLVALAGSTLLPAQGGAAFVRAVDLVVPSQHTEPYLTPVLLRGRRLLAGEGAWLGLEFSAERRGPELHLPRAAWFEPSALQQLLGDALGREAEDLQFLPSGLIAVPRGFAAVVEQSLAELRQCLPPLVRTELRLVRRRADEETVVLGRTADFAAGRLQWVSGVQTSSAVVDHEVELAQGATIGSPVMYPIVTGAMVALCPFTVGSEAEAFLQILVRVVASGNEAAFEPGETSTGSIDRAHQHVRELAAIARVRIGEPIVQRWQAHDEIYELHLAANWQPVANGQVAGRPLEYLPCWPDFAGFRTSPWSETARPADELAPAAAEFRAALAAAGVALRCEDAAFAVAVASEAVSLRALGQARGAGSERVRLRLEWFDAKAGAAAVDAAEATVLGAAEFDTVLGSSAAVTAYEELTVVADWDVEVAQSARIPDPKCERIAAGLFANVLCTADGLALDGEVSWRAPFVARDVRLARAVSVPGSVQAVRAGDHATVQEQPPTQLAAEVVRVESCPVRRLPYAMRLPLLRDRPAVGRVASAMLGPGRELVVRARRVD